jgi:hypothetical protein
MHWYQFFLLRLLNSYLSVRVYQYLHLWLLIPLYSLVPILVFFNSITFFLFVICALLLSLELVAIEVPTNLHDLFGTMKFVFDIYDN